jgi:DnaJ-class molecular chaperone
MKNPYVLLGLEVDASISKIKSAYRKKASLFHPDKNPSPDASEKFQEIHEAYELLSDSMRRRDYDENQHKNLVENPSQTAKEIWESYIEKIIS